MRLGEGFGVSSGSIAALLLLAGCSGEPANTAEQDRADAKAIAQVMAQQTPPPALLKLQPMLIEDITAHNALSGPGCFFTPNGGEDPTVIVGPELGYVKYEGSVQRLANDPGSAQGPFDTHEKYDGREYTLRIAIDQSARDDADLGSWVAPATVVVLDGFDRTLVESRGRAGCGA
ncbi:MAG: hypothetical protein GW855_01780 [Erythrobacter sp.]|nr:hypothetical protein [Erythrobacter sp.]NCQ64642.1 hypothetical protein [Alphaproteobacteria bacterium]